MGRKKKSHEKGVKKFDVIQKYDKVWKLKIELQNEKGGTIFWTK